jgi:sodium/hydrogen exchanger 8
LLPEAGMIILVGTVAGFCLMPFVNDEPENDDAENVAQSLSSFSPKIFFIALLPPIIFNSGYHLRRELFLRHLTPICLLACIGTIVSAVVIALVLLWASKSGYTGGFDPTLTELLTFGALISATDPVSTLAVFQSKRVDPHLFYLVFGESVMNDAVGIVLFNAFAKFVQNENNGEKVIMGVLEFCVIFTVNLFGSLCLGVIAGIMAAMLFKYVDMRQTTLLELSLYIMIMYVPFLLAEILHLSGIVTILFSGIAARRYIVPNLSEPTTHNAEVCFRLAAHLAETSIFLELGLSVAGLFKKASFNWLFLLWALLACLVGRALNVYPISFLYNLSLRIHWKNDAWKKMDNTILGQQHDHVEMTDASTDKEVNKNESGETYITATPDARNDQRIRSKTGHMLWFAGLRGAVAYACVKSFPDTFGNQMEFMATTMAIVLLTVFLLGGITEMVLSLLKIETDVDEDQYMENFTRDEPLTGFVQTFGALVMNEVVGSLLVFLANVLVLLCQKMCISTLVW